MNLSNLLASLGGNTESSMPPMNKFVMRTLAQMQRDAIILREMSIGFSIPLAEMGGTSQVIMIEMVSSHNDRKNTLNELGWGALCKTCNAIVGIDTNYDGWLDDAINWMNGLRKENGAFREAADKAFAILLPKEMRPSREEQENIVNAAA